MPYTAKNTLNINIRRSHFFWCGVATYPIVRLKYLGPQSAKRLIKQYGDNILILILNHSYSGSSFCPTPSQLMRSSPIIPLTSCHGAAWLGDMTV